MSGSLPTLELTIQDYFAHFPAFCLEIYRPHLLTDYERGFLARSITSCTEPPRDPTQHPAFTKLDLVGKAWKEFESLAGFQRWPKFTPHNQKYRRNREAFSEALANSCRRLIKWAEEDLKLEAERHLASDLSDFFTAFQCKAYRYYRHNPPLKEFERLGQIKGWGEVQLRFLRIELEDILKQHKLISCTRQWAQAPETPGDKAAPLNNFFSIFERVIQAYTYNPAEYPPREFDRLRKASAWSSWEIARNKRQFNEIYGTTDAWAFYVMTEFSGPNPVTRPDTHIAKSSVTTTVSTALGGITSTQSRDPRSIEADLSKSPIALFCKGFNSIDYRYADANSTPTKEFEKLSKAVEQRLNYLYVAQQWASTVLEPREPRVSPDSNLEVYKFLSFWKSQVYRELQYQFYRAVEKQFDWFVDIQCYRTGMEKHEYLVVFFEAGDGSGRKITQDKGEKLLSKIHINIYDFLDHHDQVLRTQDKLILPPSAERHSSSNMDNLASSLKVVDIGSIQYPRMPISTPTIPTKFPTVELLGIYCEVTKRIFNMHAAMSNGILRRLLKSVGRYFGPKARGKYLAELALSNRDRRPLADIDVMMLTKIKEFYELHYRCAGHDQTTEDVPNKTQDVPDHPEHENNLREEAKHNLHKYRSLFDRAREQQSSKKR
ncbi:hypothetical protein EV426DRAFT_640323 [Tirmania nivea]|nr:hypothetical protein EV426DRAFT_640323 [Tirmania nivea]